MNNIKLLSQWLWFDFVVPLSQQQVQEEDEEEDGGLLDGMFYQEILTLRASILQAGSCQILSLAENLRWNRVWQSALT